VYLLELQEALEIAVPSFFLAVPSFFLESILTPENHASDIFGPFESNGVQLLIPFQDKFSLPVEKALLCDPTSEPGVRWVPCRYPEVSVYLLELQEALEIAVPSF